METAEEVKQEAETQIRHIRREVREGLSASEEFVRDHPLTSISIASGIGFVLAQLPMRTLGAGLIKAIVFLLKPAAVFYALSKIVQGSASPRMREGEAPEI